MERTSLLDHTDAFFPHEPSFYFSHPSHGGILRPTDASFSPSAAAHRHTLRRSHQTLTSTVTQGRHPLSFKCTQSPFTRQKTHTHCTPVWMGALYQYTRTHSFACTQTSTWARPLSTHPPHRLIGSPFGWCHFVRVFCCWLHGELLGPGCVLWGPQDGGPSRVLTWKALKSFIWNGHTKFTRIIF